MNLDLVEELLNEEEGSTLDFKRDQYPFQAASDEQKGELLKDILAFANAWRRTEAYILVGVEEIKGGRSTVVGITTHFDDAAIQQFVNGKTNRPVTFSYEVVPFEGVQIDVIRIQLQERPIFLKRDFGRLRQNEIYIRRGSATDIANPDEVAKMGALHIRETLGEFPASSTNRVVEALQHEFQEQNPLVVEKLGDHSFRMQCTVADVNDLYATFADVKNPQSQVSGPIDKITISYEPAMGMKLITIARN